MGTQATLRSSSFRDFDAFAASIEDADMSMKLPRLDRSFWSMQQITLPDSINIQVAYEGSGSIPAGAVRDDGFVLFLAEGDCQANGEQVDRDSVFLMPPGKEFCNPTKGENEWMGIFIPCEIAEQSELITSRDAIGSSARVVRPSPGAAVRLRTCIKKFVVGAKVEPSLLHEVASISTFRELLAACVKDCLVIATHSQHKMGRPATVDAKLITSALELIEDAPESISTIPELVARLGVSERAVQTGFKKFLGISPQRYMELSRLHYARKRLLTVPLTEASVTKVAAQIGMWDFGRFAGRYTKLFGEKPSEKLRRREQKSIKSSELTDRM